MSEVKKWDNNIYEYDVTEASRLMNPWLKNYGRDRLTYNPETTFTSTAYLLRNEGSQSHGYPQTAWLQLAIVYGCGLYTAKEQGIVRKRVFFQKFWTAHYFDWLLFARRGFTYGIVGGLLAGTLLFGDQRLALRRAVSRYQYLFCMEKTDPQNRETLYMIKNR
jgi:hypothetical protein